MTCRQAQTWKLPTPRMTIALAWIFVFALLAAGTALAQKQEIAQSEQALNMRLVGVNDLQARSAYQPVIQEQSGRWIAYIGHHGGSVLNSADRQDRTERHLRCRCDRSAQSKVSFPYPGFSGGNRRSGWRANGSESVTEKNCPKATQPKPICSVRAGTRRMRFWMSQIQPNQYM